MRFQTPKPVPAMLAGMACNASPLRLHPNQLTFLLILVLVAVSSTQPAFSSCAVPIIEQVDAESPQQINLDHPTAKRKLVEKIVPVVPIWTAISHNPLVLALRFHGVTKALRKEVDIGQLKMRGFGKDARIKLAGTRKIDGETLPFVSIRYPRKGVAAGGAGVELANMQGKIKSLSLDLAIRVPKRSDGKLVFAYLDPGQMTLDVDSITGSESTSFGDPIPFSVGETVVTNAVPIALKRSTRNSALWATGELRLDGTDLDFKQVALSFEGENNVLTLAGQVRMPNQITWGYEMLDRRLIWKAGQLEITDLSLEPQPAHQINFGGIALTLKGIKIDSATFTKKEFPADALPSASLAGLALDASDINYKKSTLTGTLITPITIKQIDAQVNITNIFEGINLSNQRLQGMHIGLANISYQNGNGLQVQGQSLDISVAKYTSNTVEGSAPDTNVTASIVLKNAPITQQDSGSFVIDQLSADLQGPTDKLNGRGTLSGTLSNATINVGIDMSGMFGKCQNKVGLQISQITSAYVQANIDIFNGEPSGEATVPHIELAFRPDYWRCDWDDPSIGFNLPGIHVGWDGIWLTPDGPHVDIGSVHWKAEFIPLTGAVGELALAEIRFDKKGAKICGGHTLAFGLGLWTPSIGPDFPDCGSWFCNIPRDIVSGIYGFFEAPAGLFLNQAALGIINTVGLFDAGIFQNKCQ